MDEIQEPDEDSEEHWYGMPVDTSQAGNSAGGSGPLYRGLAGGLWGDNMDCQGPQRSSWTGSIKPSR